MSVTKDDVRRIADLARLNLDPGTTDRLAEELNGILAHVKTLGEVELPTESRDAVGEPVPGEGSVFRDPDLHPDGLESGAPARGAPEWREGFFLVPGLPALTGEEGRVSSDDGEASR